MELKLVSAIIITHNRVELLKKAIESVLNQTYSNIEIIVVDDASEEENRCIVQNYAEQYKFKYIYIPKEESKGGNHARNVGIKNSNGEYVALLDDDDEWLPDKIYLQVQTLERMTDSRICTCGMIYYFNSDSRVKQDLNKLNSGNLKEIVWTKIPMVTSTILMYKSLATEIGLFDENLRYWQEYEFTIRACQATNVTVVKDWLVLFRISKKDKKRLTNNISGWMDAVEYIDSKHREILNNQSDMIRHKHELMIANDGLKRSNNIGDKKLQKKYLKEILELEPTIKNKICYLLNINRIKFWKQY